MVIFIVGILLILYGFLSKQKYSVWVGILFVLLIMGFQEGVPGDYQGYQMRFNSGGSDGTSGGSVKLTEFSFILITTTLSKFMDFHWFVLLSSFCQCLIFALLIKSYVDKKHWYFGVLLVFFTVNIMLLQMKAMRQGYAVDMLLLAYLLLDRRKYLWSILSMIIAFGFHNSSSVAIPFFLIYFIIFFFFHRHDKKTPNNTEVVKVTKGITAGVVVVIGLFIFLVFKYFVFSDYINPYLMTLDFFEYSDYLQDYSNIQSIRWWVVVYYAAILFSLTVYYANEHNLFKKYSTILSIVGILVYLSFFGFGNLMRLAMFFVPFNIIILPNVTAMLRASYGKHVSIWYVLFNMVFLMKFSVEQMLSDNYEDGTGFYSYTFSFLNW